MIVEWFRDGAMLHMGTQLTGRDMTQHNELF